MGYFQYQSTPDELGMFGIGDTVFIMVTAPASALGGDVEIIPTFEEGRVIVAVSQEKFDQTIPKDMPDVAKGMAMGMLISACIQKAEQYIAGKENESE
jgi:hypothetical protein